MAKQRGRGASSKEVQASRVGGEELEVAPFTLDSTQVEAGGKTGSSNKGSPDAPLGQFGDAEMEFEPFMFNPGQVDQAAMQIASAAIEVAPAGFSFEPFSPTGNSVPVEGVADMDPSPIVGGDLPLPSYLSAGQGESSAPADPVFWVTEDPAPPISNETTTSGLKLPTGPIQSLVGTDTGGLGITRGEQMTGRTPTGPLPAVPMGQTATTPVTGLGRTRGNTGPLGPLPPDRTATPNASWSDSSLASIEDFSSILIAMQAGKKLRQSTPLNESMIPQSATATLEAPPQVEEFSLQSTDQLRAQMADATLSTQPEIKPLSRPLSSEDISPFDTPSAMAEAGPQTQDIPEWAVQAAQTYVATHELAQADTADTPEPIFYSTGVDAEEAAPTLAEATIGQAEAGAAADAAVEEGAPNFTWVTGQWEPDLPGAPAIGAAVAGAAVGVVGAMAAQEVEQEETPVMAAPVEAPASEVATAETIVAASAELAASREQAADGEPSNLEPDVAEALKNVNPIMIGGNLTGEELEFEGFMFNEGNSTPLSALPGLAGDEHSEIPHDMGPVFDPTPYLQAVEDESEEIDEYVDLDQAILNELRQPMAMGMPGPSPAPAESAKTGDLPFWLQGDSNEAPTGILIQDIAQRGWGTKEFLNEPARPMPSEWVGEVSEAAPAELSRASVEMATPERAQAEDFGDLPPIEPFDFSFLPTNEMEQSLGFNTGELIGMAPDDHDPMTITVNLAAVADLLGEEEVNTDAAYDEMIGSDMPTEMSMSSGELIYVEMADVQAEEESQPEWALPNMEVEAETVADLDMDMLSTEPAVAVDLDMPAMGYEEAAGAAAGDFQAGEEPATSALDAAADLDYGAEITEVSPESPYVPEVEPPAIIEAMEYRHTAPIGEGRSPRGWMASATTNLTDTTLAGMTGELPAVSSPTTEMDLALDGVEVSPFDYAQLDLESEEEQRTGQLEPDQIQRGYGTGKLVMPEEDDVMLRSRPLDDVWSEADGDASLFVTVPAGEGPMETAPQAQAEVESEPQAVEMEPPVERYDAVPVETSPSANESWAAPAQVPIQVDATAPAEGSEFKARVASNRWMAYEKQPAVAEPEPQSVTQEAEIPAAQDMGRYDTPGAGTGPAPWEHGGQAANASPTMQAESAQRAPRVDAPVRLPTRGDIMASGPLPSLDRFEDMNEWTSQNPEGLGAQLAMATAYVQSEDYDAALRVYRRIIRKSSTSQTVLRMIGDDLMDLEDVMQGLPRYYQVVGDILLRLGRHNEAIEAYNKIK